MKARLLFGATLLLALAILAVVQLILATPPAARAGGEHFWVSTSQDDPDETPGDCECLTAYDTCTLRAAVEEANEGLGRPDDLIHRWLAHHPRVRAACNRR